MSRPLYYLKNGKLLPTSKHVMSFRGCHNRSKCLVLVFLYNQSLKEGYSARELHKSTGVPMATLRSALCSWVRWRYIKRLAKIEGNKAVLSYNLDQRGKHVVMHRIPQGKLYEFEQEIREARQKYNDKLKQKVSTIRNRLGVLRSE